MDGVDSHVVLLKQMPLIDETLVFALPVRDLLLALSIQAAILTAIQRQWYIPMTHDIVENGKFQCYILVELPVGGEVLRRARLQPTELSCDTVREMVLHCIETNKRAPHGPQLLVFHA